MPKVGDALGGKYLLEKLIGKGGMGEVFVARQKELGKRVAVKSLFPQDAKDAKVTARFLREAQAAAAIGHRGIIDIYDTGETDDGGRYLVMEYLEGTDLAGLLDQKGRLEADLVIYIASQVLSALDAAHRKGIVHRDLKPDNIFLVETRQAYPEVKLLDFGISKMNDAEQRARRLTETGMLMGTPFYMAPEQAKALKDIDHRVDLWAMGVLLYEALTGRLPFNAEALYTLVYQILHEPIVPPRTLNDDIPPALEQVILRGMARNRDQRYRSASEMLADLLPLLDREAMGRISMPEGFDRDLLVSGEHQSPDALASTLHSTDSTPAPEFALMEALDGEEVDTEQLTPPGGEAGQAEDVATADTPMRRAGSDAATADTIHSGSYPRPSSEWLDESTPLPESSEPESPRRSWLPIGLGAALLIVVVGGVAFWLGGDTTTPGSEGDASATVDPPPADKVPPPANDSGAAPDDGVFRPPPATPRKTVTIKLLEVPEDARVYLEGALVGETEFRLLQDSIHKEIRIELDGHRPWRRMVSLQEDQELTVVLEKARGKVVRPRGPQKRPPDKRPTLQQWGAGGKAGKQ